MQLYILIKACVVSPCTSVLSSNSLASNSEVPYTLYLSSPPLTSTTDKGWGLFVFFVLIAGVCVGKTQPVSSLWIFPCLFRSTFIHQPVVTVSLAWQRVPDVPLCSRCGVCLKSQYRWVSFFFLSSRSTWELLHLLSRFGMLFFVIGLFCFVFLFHWLFEGVWSDHSSVSALWRTWTKWLVYSHFCSFIAETIHWIYCMIECKKKNLYSCLFYMSNSWYMYVTWF